MLYSLVLNTGRMDIHQAIKIITDVASMM
jgi:hypothetical protein